MRYPFSLLFVWVATLLVLGGCSKSDPDACENVSCGTHGVCQDGSCVCTDGYSGSNCDIPPAAPVAAFSMDKTACEAPCTINLTSSAQNAASLSWECIRGSGATGFPFVNNSTSPNASVEFGSTDGGVFTIRLTATNGSGSDVEEKTVTITNPTTAPPCEVNNTAEITVHMTGTDNPYSFYLDGVWKGSISGGASRTFTVSAGSHSIKVEQESGFVFTPTIVTDTQFFDECEQWAWTPL